MAVTDFFRNFIDSKICGNKKLFCLFDFTYGFFSILPVVIYGFIVQNDMTLPVRRVHMDLILGRKDQAAKFMGDFKKHLNNEALARYVSAEAKADLNARADELIRLLGE